MTRRVLQRWLLLPLGMLLLGSVAVSSAQANDPAPDEPGGLGIDTALPRTESEVTVSGRGRFADLKITVNQTENLTNQAVSLEWTGGTQTRRGPGQFAAHFLQIFQCWGDPDDTIPENPGPPPEQCVAGASTARFGGIGTGIVPAANSTRRIISRDSAENYNEDVGFTEPGTGLVWREFRAVDGTTIGSHINPDYDPRRGGIYWTNPYFNLVTTNEVSAAVTRSDGTGIELFQVLTGQESTGLGCGQQVQAVEGGGTKIPQCWIVVVPRGDPASENEGTDVGGDRADAFGVVTSPLAELPWQNRIAIPIEFNPVDTACSIADVERRLAGNDLVLQAVARWQPALCETGELPPYSYAPIPDSSARQQLTNPTAGSPGMVVVSRPIDPEVVPDDNPVVYAPVALTGVTIGFNVERIFTLEAPEDEAARLTGQRIENMNLTPRLVAKLLTQSYAAAVEINGSDPGYDWLADQPSYLGVDPDFIQFNEEFDLLRIGDRRTFSQLQLPAGNSDAALLVWEWILADPEAAAWLAGEPDEFGMVVNPAYSTDPEINPAGIDFADPVPNAFPKADPYCYQAPPTGLGNSVVPPLLCGTDWMPYARSFEETAARARRGFDGARIASDIFAARPTDVWNRVAPQFVGRRSMISLTDAPNASLLGLQVAGLSRAGDNGADRTFVEPESDGFLLGLSAMEPGAEPQVLEPALTDQPEGAYPLTALVYTASAPLSLDAQAREEYAAFVEYAVLDGQEPGFRPGELPAGYEPLPEALRLQALANAEVIVGLQPPPPTTTTTTTTTPPPPPAPPVAPPVVNPPVFPGGSGSSGGSSGGGSSGGGSSGGGSSGGGGAVTETTTIVATETTVPETTVPATVPETTEPATVESIPTPGDDTGPVRVAVPVLGGVGLVSAWAALELTKRSRRATETDDPPTDDAAGAGPPGDL